MGLMVVPKLVPLAGWLFFFTILFSSAFLTPLIIWMAVFAANKNVLWTCRVLTLSYGSWIWLTRKVPRNGHDPRSLLLTSILRPILLAAGQYFSPRLIYDFDVEEVSKKVGDRPIMVGSHPHGILSFGMLSIFGTKPEGHSILPGRPPTILLTLNIGFYLPVWRELLLGLSVCSVSKSSIKALLRRKKDVVIVVGGAREALLARPGHADLVLRNRKGFFRIALQSGAVLMPLFVFGENELFEQLEWSWLRWVQNRLLKIFSFSLPIFYGKYGPFPEPIPLKAVMGAPIISNGPIESPSSKEVAELQERYTFALTELYEKYHHLTPNGAKSLKIVY